VAQATRKREPQPPLAPKILRLVREASLYLLVAITAYLLISLWSYHAADPGWSHSGNSARIENLGGRAGAWLADVLLHLFGYVAFLLPVLAGTAAVRLFLNRKTDAPRDKRVSALIGAGLVLTVLGAAGLASLHFTGPNELPFTSGGVLGNWAGQGLAEPFSFVGATIFLLAVFFAGFTVFTGLSWLKLMDLTGKGSFLLVVHARAAFATLVDHLIGLRARKQRRETVAEEKKVLEKHAPPRIEPVLKPIAKSERVEREKQVPLFDVPAGAGVLPPLKLLDPAEVARIAYNKETLETLSRLLEKKLLDFDIEAQVVAVHPGPVITRFEIDPAPGVKASQITNLARDLARALSVISLRVVENIPGKSTVGIEIPNENRETVRLSDVLSSQAYDEVHSPLVLALGKDIGGAPVIVDLAKMPHLLIAGTTGSGKSVCINALILSMVYKSTPEQVRLIMVDPKMLELASYEGIPHLLAPVVTDMKQAANALRWAIVEMERRYRLMAALGVRNISGYNNKVREADKAGKPILDPIYKVQSDDDQVPELKPLPYIVIFIDELADLMMVVGKKVEELIARLAQKARAAGVHLIVATQRPSVDVITGLIKANIPVRIAFQVSARVDSRTILDQMGAEQLLGQGDMLFLTPGSGVPLRVHGAFVSDNEVHRVVNFLKKSGKPSYDDSILTGEAEAAGVASVPGLAGLGGSETGEGENDPLYDEALKIVTETRRASISGVQRRLRIGYNRAARLIEEMEKAGVVGPMQTNGNREVLAAPPPPRD
jgi:S-DNA-T family DNA segregation ATPase FtsK/SpoIIIE